MMALVVMFAKLATGGTGDFELNVRSATELDQVKALITKSYEAS